MGSIESINCTYNVVPRSPAHMLVVNLNNYGHKWLILASYSIVFPIRHISPRFDGSLGLSRNVSDLPKQPCNLSGFQN